MHQPCREVTCAGFQFTQELHAQRSSRVRVESSRSGSQTAATSLNHRSATTSITKHQSKTRKNKKYNCTSPNQVPPDSQQRLSKKMSAPAPNGATMTAAPAANDARDPSGFLSEIIGAPVTVKLNSGVVYKGMSCRACFSRSPVKLRPAQIR